MKDISSNEKHKYKVSSEITSMLRDLICLNEYNWIFRPKEKNEALNYKKISTWCYCSTMYRKNREKLAGSIKYIISFVRRMSSKKEL